MKIMVTGASGFIGSALSWQLLEDGHEVVGVDCFLPDLYPARQKINNLEPLLKYKDFTIIEKNLVTDDLRKEIEGVDVVINEAGVPGLAYSWSNFASYSNNNIVALGNLLNMLADFPSVYLVHASSSSVYGEYIEGDEKLPLNPVSPYGVSKLAAEKIIETFAHREDRQYVILRYFSVYGPRQRPDMAYSKICQNLLNNEPIVIRGDGSQARNNTYISDIVNATILAATIRPSNLAMNICGNEEITLLGALEILADRLGVCPRKVFYPKVRGDQSRTKGSSNLASEVLGWNPRIDIRQGLSNQAAEAIETFRS